MEIDLNVKRLQAKESYLAASARGFWDDRLDICRRYVLILSEITEIVDAARENKWSKDLRDGSGLILDYNLHIKGTVEEEFADTWLRVMDLLGGLDVKVSIFDQIKELDGFDMRTPEVPKDIDSMCYLLSCLCNTLAAGFSEVILNLKVVEDFPDVDEKYTGNLGMCLLLVANQLEIIAEYFEIPLFKFIDYKQDYNKTRPHKHGKIF